MLNNSLGLPFSPDVTFTCLLYYETEHQDNFINVFLMHQLVLKGVTWVQAQDAVLEMHLKLMMRVRVVHLKDAPRSQCNDAHMVGWRIQVLCDGHTCNTYNSDADWKVEDNRGDAYKQIAYHCRSLKTSSQLKGCAEIKIRYWVEALLCLNMVW